MNNLRSLLSNFLHINTVLYRNYAFKSDLKIKWIRPEKIPCYKPEKSGDLSNYPNLDKTQLLIEFQDSKELQTADENVRKLFTLEFAPKRHMNKVYYENMINKVKRHDYDKTSIEVRIARWTGIIRAQQGLIERFPRNRKLKVCLKELIDKRKKHLKYLRKWDYKKFEWLLENLDIVYKPPPDHFHWITRKESLQKLTDKYCEDIKNDRLLKYKLQLENEQPAFLEEKYRTLKFIRDEQKNCGVEITVSEEEIEQVKQQLEQLKKNANEDMLKDN